jgi:hypothetical protein
MKERMREILARHWVIAVAGLILFLAVIACGGSDELPTLQPTAAIVEVPADVEEPTGTPSPSPQIMCTAVHMRMKFFSVRVIAQADVAIFAQR